MHAERIAAERQALGRLMDDVTEGLQACLDASGVLQDPCHNGPSPSDHYAHLFTALALMHQPDAPWQVPLDQWLSFSPQRRGHEPFNRLALRLLEASLSKASAKIEALGRVREAIRQCPLGRRYASNNWSLLASVIAMRESPPGARKALAKARFHRQLRAWTTSSGGFVDFPARVGASGGATPPAYHMKYLLCLWLAVSEPHDDVALEYLQRGLDWLALFLTPSGYCGGFGRTNHGLFGDACLLTVLHGLMGHAEKLPQGTTVQLLEAANAMRQRLRAQQRPDGLLWLTPVGECGASGGWDNYMHLTVYNAWIAGLLKATLVGHPWLRGDSTGDWMPGWSAFPAPPVQPQLREDAQAGLLRYRRGQVDLMASTHGQPVQGFSTHEVDLRQAAMLPFHLEWQGLPCMAPPLRLSVKALRAQPKLAGAMPLLECDEMLYGMSRLDTVTWQETERGLCISGQGQPRALLRAASVGLWGRIRDALDWRMLNGALGRAKSLDPCPLFGHHWCFKLELDAATGVITFTLELQGHAGSRARWLNPQGQTVLAPAAGSAHGTSLGPGLFEAAEPLPWPEETHVYQWSVPATRLA